MSPSHPFLQRPSSTTTPVASSPVAGPWVALGLQGPTVASWDTKSSAALGMKIQVRLVGTLPNTEGTRNGHTTRPVGARGRGEEKRSLGSSHRRAVEGDEFTAMHESCRMCRWMSRISSSSWETNVAQAHPSLPSSPVPWILFLARPGRVANGWEMHGERLQLLRPEGGPAV